jgi:hypothetical protein
MTWLSQDAYELRETLKLARGFYAKAPDHSRSAGHQSGIAIAR